MIDTGPIFANFSSARKELQCHDLAVRINSINDASISCKISWHLVQSLQSWQSSFVNVRYDVAKKLAYFVNLQTGPIFAICSPYESAFGADDKSGPCFMIWQGTLLCTFARWFWFATTC